MAYLPVRFPDRIARGAVGGHGHFDTTIAVGTSGYETANGNWQRARGAWNVSHGVKTDRAHEECRAHFYMAHGRLHWFRFKDWGDYEVKASEGRLVAAPGGYQAFRAYGSDPTFQYLRKLTRIVAGTWQAYSGGAPVASTIDVETGLCNVGGAGYTFSCEFDVPARYDTDRFDVRIKAMNRAQARRWFEWADIDIVERRE